jgi:integrase/recombinase XerD
MHHVPDNPHPTPAVVAAQEAAGGIGQANGHPPPIGRKGGPGNGHGAAIAPPIAATPTSATPRTGAHDSDAGTAAHDTAPAGVAGSQPAGAVEVASGKGVAGASGVIGVMRHAQGDAATAAADLAALVCRVRELLAAGTPPRDTARAVGIGPGLMFWLWVKRHCPDVLPRKPAGPALAAADQAGVDRQAELVRRVRALLAAGHSKAAVARAAGMPGGSLRGWLARHPEALPPRMPAVDRTRVVLEGRPYRLRPRLREILDYLLVNPGCSLAALVADLRLSGPAAGHGNLTVLNACLDRLDPPLTAPFRFRVVKGAVERYDPTIPPTPEPASPLRAAVRRFLAYLAAERGLAANTVKSYGFDLGHYIRWAESPAGPEDPLAATLGQLEAFLVYLRTTGLAPASLARAVACLRSFAKFLTLDARGGTLAGAALLEPPRLWQRLPEILTVSQVLQLLGAPSPRDRCYLRDKVLLELLVSLGGRASELADLQLADVRLDQGTCLLRGKGGRFRAGFLTGRAVAAVRAYLERLRPRLAARNPEGPPPWLLLNKHGRRLSRVSVFLLVRKHGRRAGLPARAAHPHCLRHSFASHLLAGGANVRNVQELLGHEDLNTTQRYTSVDRAQLVAAHARFHPRGALTQE